MLSRHKPGEGGAAAPMSGWRDCIDRRSKASPWAVVTVTAVTVVAVTVVTMTVVTVMAVKVVAVTVLKVATPLLKPPDHI